MLGTKTDRAGRASVGAFMNISEAPNVELREMALDGTIDLLHGFSDACRDEFEEIKAKQF
jgi:hypothetical protein